MEKEEKVEKQQYKIVYNAVYGGFSLSREAFDVYNKKRLDEKLEPILQTEISLISRDDPHLIQIVEELGLRANGRYGKLKIQSIPYQYKKCWSIREYDGKESIIFDAVPYIRELLHCDIDSFNPTETRDLLKKIQHLLCEARFF